MKFAKKLMSVLLAVLMMISMVVPAMADDPAGTITIKHAHAGHVYLAYQIFDGTLQGGILTDIEWGSGVGNGDGTVPAEFLTKIQNIDRAGGKPLAGKTTAADVAEAISNWSTNDAALNHFAEICAKYLVEANAYTSGEGPASTYDGSKYIVAIDDVGYYLVKDKIGTPALAEATATDYMLQVLGNVTLEEPKAVNPNFSKSVNNTREGTYKEAIAAEVGETIYFKLESKMPSKLMDYKQYVLYFEEALPDELEGEEIVDVYIEHYSGVRTPLAEGVTYENKTEDDHLKIATYNLLDTTKYPVVNINDTVVVKYSATLKPTNKLGKITEDGKGIINEATLHFSNDMNQEFSNEDGFIPSFAQLTDRANVYTFGAEINKVSGADHNTKLQNAQFALYRNVTEGDVKHPHYAVVDANGLITNWTPYKDAKAIEDANLTPEEEALAKHATILATDAQGQFTVKGLGAAAYQLEEIEPPMGYNTMDAPVVLTVIADINSVGELTGLSGKADYLDAATETKTGILSYIVENTPGSTLPATGGMGTTIFYAAGAVLLLGSIAAFAVKKREED